MKLKKKPASVKNLKIILKSPRPLLFLHMKEPLDMVDEHIDTFIQTGRHKWDLVHLIF
jgi:hypothetical protein